MFEIKQFMTSDVITVKKNTLISEAIAIMLKNDITGLPVVEDDMSLVGILSEKDVLGIVYDLKDCSAIVEDYMTTNVVSFELNEEFINICQCLINNNFRRVPIVSGGKLVGIISRSDIVKYLFRPVEYI